MHTRVIALLIAFVAFGGTALAADVTVTVMIQSDPAGATVYANTAEKRMGYAPVALKYKVPSKEWAPDAPCKAMEPLMVRWPSGVTAKVDSVQVCPAKGKKQELTFVRPVEAPGREMDAAFALELARIKAGQEAAAVAAIGAITASIPKQTHCTSTVIGTQTFTNCY